MNEDKRRRVPPLSPDERRAALIRATLPLLRDEGLNVSTRKIAECAGVAEGTIFRVFPEKSALIAATLAYAFDPAPTIESIEAVAGDPDLRFRLRHAVHVIWRRFRENIPLVVMLRSEGLTQESTFPDAREGLTRIVAAIADVLRPDQHRLRLPVDTIAWLVVSMVMFGNRGDKISGDDIVSLVLDGAIEKEVPC